MATTQNIGILVASTLRPTFVDDIFPIVLSQDIKGGIHTITSSSYFNEINVNRRDWGMLAFLYDEQKFYQLLPQNAGTPDLTDDANWIEFSSGSGGSLEWVDSVKGIYNDNTNILPLPVDGERYLVGSSGAATFSGHNNEVAVFRQYLNNFNGGYIYTSPPNGCTLRVDNEPGVIYTFVGTSSSTGNWYKERQNTVRYIYPTSNNGLTFSYTTSGETPLLGYTYSVFYANFATSNSGTVSLSIDGNFYAPIKKVSSNALTDLSSGDFGAGVEYQLTYDNGVFQIFLSSASQGGTIGPAEDLDYTDGLFTDFTPSTPIGTPIDRFNEILKALVPPPAPDLNSWSVNPQSQFVTGRLSYNHAQEPALPAVSATFSEYGDVTQGGLFAKDAFSGYRLGITSKSLQTNTGTTYYQNITGVLNSNVPANPNLPTAAYPANAFGSGITGSIVLYLNSYTASVVDLGSTYNAITNTTADGILSVSAATASKFSNGNPFEFFWYRTGTYSIIKTSTYINSGHNKIVVKHILPASTITLNSYEFIADASTSVTTFNSAVGTPNFSNLNTKFLSGIQYYTSGSLGYSVVSNNVYRNTYYSGTDAGTFQDVSVQSGSTIYNGQLYPNNITNFDVFAPSPTTISLPQPTSVIDTYQFQTNFNVQSNRRIIDGTTNLNITVKRTVQGTTTGGTLSTSGWFIDTVTSGSTNLTEDFNSEGYRLTNSTFNTVSQVTSDSWNSQSSLLNTYQNALQVADGRLLYPSFNFFGAGSTIDTNPNRNDSGRNYTNCKINVSGQIHGTNGPAGDNYRTYTRVFDLGSTSYAKFSVVATFSNTTFVPLTTALSNNSRCYVEFKLPYSTGTPTGGLVVGGAVTGWLDACKAYDGTILPNDGQGCLEGNVPTTSGSSWKINFGGRNTFYSGGKVLMRITAGRDWTGYIESITIVPG